LINFEPTKWSTAYPTLVLPLWAALAAATVVLVHLSMEMKSRIPSMSPSRPRARVA